MFTYMSCLGGNKGASGILRTAKYLVEIRGNYIPLASATGGIKLNTYTVYKSIELEPLSDQVEDFGDGVSVFSAGGTARTRIGEVNYGESSPGSGLPFRWVYRADTPHGHMKEYDAFDADGERLFDRGRSIEFKADGGWQDAVDWIIGWEVGARGYREQGLYDLIVRHYTSDGYRMAEGHIPQFNERFINYRRVITSAMR